MKIKIRVFLILLILTVQHTFMPSPLAAQHATWITVEGTASIDHISKEEARKLAIEDAVHKAPEKALAANISAQTLIVNLRLSGSILGAIPYGKVVEKRIIEEFVEEAQKEEKHGPSSIYRVKMKACVVEETTKADPDFRLEVSLNKTSFKDGEEMVLTVKSTKNCYLLVFNLLEDEQVLRLIPNRFKQDTFLKAGQPFLFPDQDDRKKELNLQVHMPEGKDAVTESFYILALKQPFHLNADQYQESIFGLYQGKAALMSELIREIVGIPLSERAEKLVSYQIRKK